MPKPVCRASKNGALLIEISPSVAEGTTSVHVGAVENQKSPDETLQDKDRSITKATRGIVNLCLHHPAPGYLKTKIAEVHF